MSEEIKYCVECGKRIKGQDKYVGYIYIRRDIDKVITLYFHVSCAALFISKLTKNIYEVLEGYEQ